MASCSILPGTALSVAKNAACSVCLQRLGENATYQSMRATKITIPDYLPELPMTVAFAFPVLAYANVAHGFASLI